MRTFSTKIAVYSGNVIQMFFLLSYYLHNQDNVLTLFLPTQPLKLHQVIEELSSRVEVAKHVDIDIKR